jgi:hypothetical protein
MSRGKPENLSTIQSLDKKLEINHEKHELALR